VLAKQLESLVDVRAAFLMSGSIERDDTLQVVTGCTFPLILATYSIRLMTPACAFTAIVGGAMPLWLLCFGFVFVAHYTIFHACLCFSCVTDDTGQSCNNYESQAQDIDRSDFLMFFL
jgi:hypothetical protein